MAAVFPESMDMLNPNDIQGSLKIIENYIRYIQERVEFSTKNVTRSVTEAGVSSANMYEEVLNLKNILSALQSVVNGMAGQISATNERLTETQNTLDDLSTNIGAANSAVSELGAKITALEEAVAGNATKLTAVEESISSMQAQISALTTRVDALEQNNGG